MRPYPKKKRLKLSVKEYQELRKKACKRAMSSCEKCFAWCPLSNGHLHHKKTRGAGGDDKLENVIWLCYLCHDKNHKAL